MKKNTLTLLLLTIIGLVGCGQTGPLYLPEDAPETTNTEAVTIKGSDGSVTKQSQTQQSEDNLEQQTQSGSEQQEQKGQ